MKKLNTHGVAHFAALAIIVLGVASYGTYRLVASHAATLNSASCQASNVQLSAASHSTGPCVTFVQQKVGASPDGAFGPITAGKVVAFQKAHNIGADGIVGPCTWAAVNGTAIPTSCLVIKPAPVAVKPAPATATPAPIAATAAPAAATCQGHPTLTTGSTGACVVYIQKVVSASPDGNFGPATASKVRVFQGQHGLIQDGTFGACSWNAIGNNKQDSSCLAKAAETSNGSATTYSSKSFNTPAPAKPISLSIYQQIKRFFTW